MTLQFGTFEFDDQAMELRRGGRRVALEPQPARALAVLLRRAGDVVTREDLRLTVWGPDTHVDFDRGLAYCLSAIRQALGDQGENPRFVQTLPKRGYCFIAPVKVCGEVGDRPPERQTKPVAHEPGVEAAPWIAFARPWRRWVRFTLVLLMGLSAWGIARRPPAAAPAILAVSVFDNETGEARYDRVVSNLTDSVVAHLTSMAPAHVQVIGNAAPLRQPRNIRNLKALAASIRADYVLLAQLQRGEAGLRIVTHFIRLPEETHLRAQVLQLTDSDEAALERAVVAEFERCVRDHVLAP